MITRIKAKGFKGCDFDQELTERTLFVGPNGAGKSARSQALQLAVNGGVIGAGKTNDDILSTFGEGDKLVVGVEIDGKYLFERGFVRGPSGSVAQGYKTGGVKVSKDYFMKALGESGAPVVLNVADFMALSDQKKIEALFSLYPPAGDVSAVQGNIDAAKEKINTLTQKVKTSEQAAARIAASKSQIQVPAGTLAEIEAKIAGMEKEQAEARQNLMQVNLDEQKAEDERKAKEAALLIAEGNARKEKERIEKEEATKKENERIAAQKVAAPPSIEKLPETPGPMEQEVNRRFGSEKVATPTELSPLSLSLTKCAVAQSIQAIIDAMDAAGCGTCVAKMIARRELRKYKEVANG